VRGLLGVVLLGYLAIGSHSSETPLATVEKRVVEKIDDSIELFEISPGEGWVAFSLWPPAGLDVGLRRRTSVMKYPELSQQIDLGPVFEWSWAVEDEVLWFATTAEGALTVLDPSTGKRRRVQRPAKHLQDLQGVDPYRALIVVGGFDEQKVLGILHIDPLETFEPVMELEDKLYELEPLGRSCFAVREWPASGEAATVEIWEIDRPSRLCRLHLPADQSTLKVLPTAERGEGLVLAQKRPEGELVVQRVSCDSPVEQVAKASGACATDKIDLLTDMGVESYRSRSAGVEVLFTPRAGDRPRPHGYFFGYDGTIECFDGEPLERKAPKGGTPQ